MTNQPQRLPEKYYARRRVAALVAILVIVALLVWGLVAWGRSSGSQSEQASAQVTSSAPAPVTTPTVMLSGEEETPTESEGADPSREQDAETREPTEQDGAPKDYCEISDLEITATTDDASYREGEQPTMFMRVYNPTAADCEIELAEDTLRFEVYDLASSERVWADTDCYPSVLIGEETFEAGSDRNFQAVWSRNGSEPGQCTDREPVPAGAYYMFGVLGNNASEAVTFNLR